MLSVSPSQVKLEARGLFILPSANIQEVLYVRVRSLLGLFVLNNGIDFSEMFRKYQARERESSRLGLIILRPASYTFLTCS